MDSDMFIPKINHHVIELDTIFSLELVFRKNRRILNQTRQLNSFSDEEFYFQRW